MFLTGLLEPVLYLLSIGIGVGGLVGKVPGPAASSSPYDEFVAPGLMAAAAMNGAVLDTTFNFFVKFKYAHTFDAMLATPLGVSRRRASARSTWALLRGALYSTVFLVTMLVVRARGVVVGGARGPAARCSSASRSPARARPARRSCARGSTSTS